MHEKPRYLTDEQSISDGGWEGFIGTIPDGRQVTPNGAATRELPDAFRGNGELHTTVVYSHIERSIGEGESETTTEIEAFAMDIWNDGLFDRRSSTSPEESQE